MKYLFCDIDGVLNNGMGVTSLRISPGRVRRLNKILSLTGAKVIIYGNWRNLGHEVIQDALVEAGLDPKNFLGLLGGKGFREKLIAEYLRQHSVCRFDYYILDGMHKLTERCLWVRKGLTNQDVNTVVDALEK